MNNPKLAEVRDSLVAVRNAMGKLKFSQCDKDDIEELIEKVESELHNNLPNVQTLGVFLNSIARSLRTEPAARDACLRVSETIEHLGVANTWQT
jgi:hypothetical protein